MTKGPPMPPILVWFRRDLRLPARARRKELPQAAVEQGDLAVVPGPVTAAPGGDDMTVTGLRGAGRGALVAVRDHGLHRHIQKPKRLVVGDVFLGLRRLDKGQGQDRRSIGHGGPPAMTWIAAELRRFGKIRLKPAFVPTATPPLQNVLMRVSRPAMSV